jgi:acetyl-CoA synthetase/medium-chain acyl-CoA synthetase
MTEYNIRDYEQTCREFKWERPVKYNFARDVIDKWAAQDPDKQAMFWVDDHGHELTRTFNDFSIASRKLCNVLKEAGVRRGDTIIVMLGRIPEWWEVITAGLRMGAVVSPGTTQLSPRDLAYRITTAGAAGIITDAANAPKVDVIADQCPTVKAKLIVAGKRKGWLSYQRAMAGAAETFITADTRADEEAICYFTSGTTGYPKMCIHTHSYAIGHEITGRFWLDLKPDDLHWNISDTGWAKAAYSSYFGPWNCGTSIFVHHSSSFNTQRTLELLQQYPITVMCGAPTVYRMLVLENLSQYQFRTLRHCTGAGEPLNPEIIETWKAATGIIIRDGYGQTETVILCGNFLCFESRFGSMGKPAPGIDLQVIDNEGNPAASEMEGDIAIKVRPERPQGLFKEYKHDSDKNTDVFRGDWYITGDRAYVDKDGYFWFVGRADDVILSAGYRIGPFEVESALIEHPAVAESAVVSSPDKIRGEVVKAFVVLAPGYNGNEELKKELQNYVRKVTAPYKYPRKLEFVDALPKTISGKIRRVDLRLKEWNDTKKIISK